MLKIKTAICHLYHFNLHFEADVGAVVEGVVALYEGFGGFELADV